jgi:hypothetical protein
MTRPRHEVDPATQGSLLPFDPGQLVVGKAAKLEQVNIEGGFYAIPVQSTPVGTETPVAQPKPEIVLSPEQQRAMSLKAEDSALNFLGRAEDAQKKISSMNRGRGALQRAGRDQAEQTRLTRAIETSTDTYRRFGRVAKTQYAHSIGIEETHEVTTNEFDEYEGRLRDVIRVHTTDPERYDELELGWREFTDTFDSEVQRQARHEEIQAELATLDMAEAA